MSVSSDHVVDKFKMRYVYDVFMKEIDTNTTTYIGRIKETPNPSGAGMLDLSRYLQLNVSQDLFDGVPFDIATTSKLDIGSTTSKQYWVQCGEEYAEYATGSAVILYNGNGTVSNDTTLTSTSTISGYTFNGVKQFSEGFVWDASPYVAPTGRTFLTNSPRTLYKEADEYITTACLFGTYSGTSFPITGATYAKVYNAAGTLLHTFNPQTGYTATSSTIQTIFSGVRIEDVVYPHGNTWNKIEFQIGSGNQTEVLTIYKNVCPIKKYDPVDIIFLNRLGAWDTFRFFGSKNEETKITRQTYERAYGTWSSPTYSYDTYERGTSNIKTDLTVTGEIMSDFIDRDTVNWLEELVTSPQVYKIEADTKHLTPISLTSNSFKKQIKGNVKMRQVSFTYEYSTQQRTQQQ
jgi:hypothetical protein